MVLHARSRRAITSIFIRLNVRGGSPLSVLAERFNGLKSWYQMPTIQRPATAAILYYGTLTRSALTLSYVATSIPHFVSFEMRSADAL
jgi:hypothetical protein